MQSIVSAGVIPCRRRLGFGAAMSLVATLLVPVFFTTTGDSATLVIGMMSTGGELELVLLSVSAHPAVAEASASFHPADAAHG